MHLVSQCDQQVHIEEFTARFSKGETIHTENSYKYSIEEFTALAGRAGWSPLKFWIDENRLFSLHLLGN